MPSMSEYEIKKLEENLAAVKARHHNELLIENMKHMRNKEYILGVRSSAPDSYDEDELKTSDKLFKMDHKLTELIDTVIKEYMKNG